ncbi:hypothetical protein ABIE51_003028 [Lysobacter sp. OAE881]|uniref:hypothetical protein n=1 Tax=Lysobacter sp. OAE881 TaxID=2663813 RepID=UPI00178A75E0
MTLPKDRREQHARIASALHDAKRRARRAAASQPVAPSVSSLHTIRLSSLRDAPKCLLSRASNPEISRNECTSRESLDQITQRKSQSET